MKKLLLIFCLFLLWSCGKDDQLEDTANNTDELILTDNIDVRSGTRSLLNYNDNDPRHSEVAKVLSLFFMKQQVRQAIDVNFREEGSSVLLLLDFLFNIVLDDYELESILEESITSVGTISHCDFFNIYLRDYLVLKSLLLMKHN